MGFTMPKINRVSTLKWRVEHLILDVGCRKDSGSKSGHEEKRDTDPCIGCRNDRGEIETMGKRLSPKASHSMLGRAGFHFDDTASGVPLNVAQTPHSSGSLYTLGIATGENSSVAA